MSRPALRTALISAFSFDQRRFAQSVSLAEVVRVLHSVAGVVFVDVDALRRFDQTSPELPAGGVLRAAGVQWQDDESRAGRAGAAAAHQPVRNRADARVMST